MKERYLVFERKNGIFFLEDRLLKKQNSLKTRDEETARRICHAKNEALRQPAINLHIARAFLTAGDPNRDQNYREDDSYERERQANFVTEKIAAGEQVRAFFLGFTARDSMPKTRARRSPAHPKQHLPTDCLGGPRAPKSAAMRPRDGTPPELSWFFVAGRGVLSERGSVRVSPKGWRPE